MLEDNHDFLHDLKQSIFNDAVYVELINLYNYISKIDLKNGTQVKLYDNVSYEVFFSLIKNENYPALHKLYDHYSINKYFSLESLRFLYLDPEKNQDNTTASGRKDTFYPHIDQSGVGLTPSCNLVFPLINCNKNTTTYWHSFDGSFYESGNHLALVNYQGLHKDVAFQTCLIDKQTVLFRSDIYHSVVNLSGALRVVCSWPAKPGYTWHEILTHFQSFD